MAKKTSRVPGRDKSGKATSRSRRISLEPAQLRLDNKRNHTTYSKDERRSYETGILENIPHMSEIGFDDTYQSICVKQSLDIIGGVVFGDNDLAERGLLGSPR